ncbi:U11-48K-like CHHC zinc finger containing protein, putative [Trypanosoma equiperdum]|uniref:U11-48K-like CHHC zinc finger containing protein, putative n=1 Tax=Trypanosoma equiperdum TaxID=5694 RepID=A0A1G4I0L0_TRYEQ|nr:U11-48K-like CHHC zinc finger containing protein, putative [Trypanosoma equiperdum]
MAEGVPAPSSSFAQKMHQLLQIRAERQPLAEGYMRCPLNPTHQVPIAAIVTHLSKAHQQDSLDIAPDAMYGVNTRSRRSEFLKEQLQRMQPVDESDLSESGYSNHRRKRYRRSSSQSYSSDMGSSSSCCSNGRSNVSRQSNSSRSSGKHRHYEERPYNNRRREEQPTQRSFHGNNTTNWHDPSNVFKRLLGRYPFGASINKQRLTEFLICFGPLQSFNFLANGTEFVVEFESSAAASKCLQAATPNLLIDDVCVRMYPVPLPSPGVAPEFSYGGAEIMRTPPPWPDDAAPPTVVSSLPAAQQNQPWPPTDITPSVAVGVGVGSKSVGVPVLSNVDDLVDAFTSVSSARITSNTAILSCAVRTTCGKNVTTEDIWKELWHFGEMRNILLVGPRVVVEFSDGRGVRRATQAMELEPGKFKFCSLLGEGEGR